MITIPNHGVAVRSMYSFMQTSSNIYILYNEYSAVQEAQNVRSVGVSQQNNQY